MAQIRYNFIYSSLKVNHLSCCLCGLGKNGYLAWSFQILPATGTMGQFYGRIRMADLKMLWF